MTAKFSAGLVQPKPAMPDVPPSSTRWINADEFIKSADAARMDPVVRILLTSDGTITTSLQALLLSPIGMEVLRQEEIPLDASAAEFLAADPGSRALAREVYLTANGQRLICASSMILIGGLDRPLLQALRTRQKPLGLLLQESGLPVLRDRLQIACIDDPLLIKTLPLTAAGPVWMRRYRMSLKSKWIAFIQEQFIGPPLRS